MQSVVSMMMSAQCSGNHEHAPVIGGSRVTTAAGHYTTEFSDALVEAFLNQFDFEQSLMFDFVDLDVDHEVHVAEHEILATEEPESDSSAELQPDETNVVIPTAVRNAVHRLHTNTGHRSNNRLARALLIAGAPREAVLAAKRLKCSICAERKSPKARMPASLPPPREVGQQVHIDLLLLDDSLRRSHVVAHVTDNVSRFQAAAVLSDKSSSSVIAFLSQHWIPLMGFPHTLVADQGKEFVSTEFCDWCDSRSIHVYHAGVGAPWQNGVAERSGATLRALTSAICQSHAIATDEEMRNAVGEAVSAYNNDVHENGVSPQQMVTGKNPRSQGDVLAGFDQHLAEHSLIEASPSMAKQIAVRETARVSMIRLHYSRGLRQAELARSRETTASSMPSPGDLVFFWRAQKYKSKKDGGTGSRSRRQLMLRRWHGPGLLVATEGKDGVSYAANCFISFRGQLTKCPTEHVRKASSLESIAAGSWEAAIDEVIQAAKNDAAVNRPVPCSDDEELIPGTPLPEAPASEGIASPLMPSEVVAALGVGGSLPASAAPSRRSSMRPEDGQLLASLAAPGTPVPDLILQASQVSAPQQSDGMASTLARARALDDEDRGVKRSAEEELPREEPFESHPSNLTPSEALAFEALVMTHAEIERIANDPAVHPLLALQAQADIDRWNPLDAQEGDHGTWDGRWAYLCERDWQLIEELGKSLPTGEPIRESHLVQAARKEYPWSQMSSDRRKLWEEAAIQGWNVYLDNKAVQPLSIKESQRVRRDLARRGELDRVLQPRFVLTDKHDGLRTASHPLPVKPSSRLVVPGYQDRSNLSGQLRRDAPTGSRLAQHFLFCVAAFQTAWSIISSDVKSAFLKGDPYLDRELYITNTNSKTSPSLPLKPGQLCRVLKGIFGLADAPREWWLRLSRSMAEHSWVRSVIDAAMWCLWSGSGDEARLEGIIVAHVDDLLFTGSMIAEASLQSIGNELGFGSQDRNDFTWCGKRIRRASDGTVRLSMVEYHENLKEIILSKERKSDPASGLSAFEARQLRAVLGSLQWLVAQVRFDMSFGVSSLQGESPPNVGTILKANSLVKEFKRSKSFELVFRPVDYKRGGIVAVSDAALGNVQRSGSASGTPLDKVYSQAGYFILLGDEDLVHGRSGMFNVVDARSHRIPRVCRSTYAAETLACEECMDVGQLCRGFLASLHGKSMLGRDVDHSINSVPLTTVVDAKDVHDKGNSDTASYGSQKSLAFTIAWMRAVLRRPNTGLKWTATTNMWVDAMTKEMSLDHLRKILQCGSWSISSCPEFLKQVGKAKQPKTLSSTACAELPGTRLSGEDPILPHLARLADQKGWHSISGLGLQVAFNARSYRTPEPRFSTVDFPLRSSFGRFEVDGQYFWHVLESGISYPGLSNQHALIGCIVPTLVTVFHPGPMISFNHFEQQKKKD